MESSAASISSSSALVSNQRRVALPGKTRVRLSDLWTSREVARVVAVRDLRSRYKQSLLGPPWLVIQPLGILAALVVAFNGVSNVNTSGIPYAPFALVGLGVWSLITMTLVNGVTAFLANGLLIKHVAAPRIAFVTSAILANLAGPAVIFIGAFAALFITGRGLPTQALLFPLVLVWLIAFTFALLCVFASVAVRFRDIQSLLPFWTQAGLFLTPVGYSLASAPGRVHTVLIYNPLSGLLELMRWCLLGTELPTLPLVVSAVFSVLLIWFGWKVFARLEITMADVI